TGLHARCSSGWRMRWRSRGGARARAGMPCGRGAKRGWAASRRLPTPVESRAGAELGAMTLACHCKAAVAVTSGRGAASWVGRRRGWRYVGPSPRRMTMRLTTLFALLLVPFAVHAQETPAAGEVARFAAEALTANCDPHAPGMAVLVARGDDVLYRGACGRASLELAVPLSPDHVFRIGSVTKQVSAAAVLKLAGAGRLSLDDPLSKFLPGYPNGDAISVRMLLDHTSGIRSYTDIATIMSGTG